MKARFILILALIGFSPAQSDEWQYYFRQGNQHYQEGDYEEAVKSYRKIIDYGYESGALYYNLGNAYFKLDEMGRARLAYERAKKFLKGDEALEQNMKMVELRLVDQINPPPELLLSIWWNAILNLFNMRVLTFIVLFLMWVLLIAGAFRLYRIRRGRRDSLKPLFIVVLLLFIFFSILYIQKIYILETEQFGVILTDKVTLRAEPTASGTELFVIHEGSKVEIKRVVNDWLEVQLVDGKTGWLLRSTLEII